MQPHNEFRIHPRIVQIGCYWGSGGHTELYLIEGDRLAIVDTGCVDTPAAYIAPALEVYGYKLADISLILNTHGHFDHTGGNGPLVAASGAEVWVHAGDAAIAADIDLQFETFFAQNDRLTGHADRAASSLQTYRSQSGLAPVDHILPDGEQIDLGRGIGLRVVSIPGHTLGSIAYCWEEEGIALIGDSVMGLGARVGSFPLIYHPGHYVPSIDRLLEMDIRRLGLGHHYRTLAAPCDSVHFGAAEIRAFLTDSRDFCVRGGEAMGQALAEDPAVGFLPAARRTVDLLGKVYPVKRDADGLPGGNTAALYGWWQALGGK